MSLFAINVEVEYLSYYTWSVYVNGERVLDRESCQVAENVAMCLRDESALPGSESREVADSILKHLKLGSHA